MLPLSASPPRFKIEYRHSDNEALQAKEDISDLDKSHDDVHELLSENYEVWLRLPSGEIINEAMEEDIIRVQAVNAADNGYPLRIRRVGKAIVMKRDIEAEPFGIQAYRFFKKYLTRPDLILTFGKDGIKRYDKIIAKQKRD